MLAFVMNRFLWGAGLFVIFLLPGCDSAPGPSDTAGLPPVLDGFSYSPQSLNVLEAPADQLVGDNVRVRFTVSVQASDPDGEVADVVLVLRSPVIDAEPILAQSMNGFDGGIYELIRDVELPRGQIGNYTVLVYAVDNEGQLSNQVRGTFLLENRGEPPVIESIEAPATIQRPPAGEQALARIVATVSDPDGLANITRVVFWNAAAPGEVFDLFDDGQSGGDETAGDGRYTITVQVTSENTPGPRVFVFQAIDRAGLSSEEESITITIE